MYNKKNLLHFFTILNAIEKIFIYTQNIKDEDEFYEKDEQLQFNAVVNLLIAIGEENKKISLNIKDDYDYIWNDISKLRDKISHNYRGISPYIVWDIINNFLPVYKKLLIRILPKIDNYIENLKEIEINPFYKNLKYLLK
jgi:uncharacterized protein with HEPN domain